MLWFKDKKRMEFIQTFIPTSKAQLIQVSMWYHKGDTQKAQEMVDFYTKNMPDLPNFDPIEPTFMQQVKSGASGLFNWIKENRGDLIEGYQVVAGIIQNKGILPTLATEATEEALEPINE